MVAGGCDAAGTVVDGVADVEAVEGAVDAPDDDGRVPDRTEPEPQADSATIPTKTTATLATHPALEARRRPETHAQMRNRRPIVTGS